MAKPFWSKAGTGPTFPNPTEGQYSVGSANVEGNMRLVAGNNSALVGPATDVEPRKTAFHRGAMGAAEALGARLSISPSMKIPQNDPASGMNMANTRLVKSRARGRNNADFFGGMSGY